MYIKLVFLEQKEGAAEFDSTLPQKGGIIGLVPDSKIELSAI